MTEGSERVSLGVTWMFLLLCWGSCATLGWFSSFDLPVRVQDPGYHPWDEVADIAATNLTVALSLVSGAATAGMSTLATTVVVSTYTGVVISAAADDLGLSGTLRAILPYFAFELAGLLCAAVVGLLPSCCALRHGWRGTTARSRAGAALRGYLVGLRMSLPWLIASVLLIAVGAVLEVAGGVPR